MYNNFETEDDNDYCNNEKYVLKSHTCVNCSICCHFVYINTIYIIFRILDRSYKKIKKKILNKISNLNRYFYV